ncbi:hypothetical protein BPOR_0619g00040 [Botrytis porri]|uniref:Uncharacterized protein n=1 Tax=Botrytis porri TaxID=87229 RepID=A0A4Z1KJ68_9HELO|nr:hypothetical protein BPOR_0619g00040 [Botrytis porri]
MPHDAAPHPRERGSETPMIMVCARAEDPEANRQISDRHATQRQRQDRDSPDLAGQACSPHLDHTITHGIAILHIRYYVTSRLKKDA